MPHLTFISPHSTSNMPNALSVFQDPFFKTPLSTARDLDRWDRFGNFTNPINSQMSIAIVPSMLQSDTKAIRPILSADIRDDTMDEATPPKN